MSNIDTVLDDLRKGVSIIVVDDYDRENEGDLVVAGECVTYEPIHLMSMVGGLTCLACSGEILDNLEIPMMVEKSTDPLKTPFTITVDSIKCSTGVSIDDRLETIKAVSSPLTKPGDLIRPGHLFPLRARPGLLRDRLGHTEGSITLMKLAGLREVAVICEIMNRDGTMSRLSDLIKFSKVYGRIKPINIISIQEIKEVAQERGVY